jgi:predicted Zn-dependent protease with MMP-like domain
MTRADKPDWKSASAPSIDEFETMAAAAYRDLPEPFRRLCDGVVIHVVDFPDDDVIAEMELESPFDIMGLFTGVGLSQDGAVAETGRMPNTIHLYRRPILDYWAEHDESLGAIVTHVLVHEIGHHFGLSDEDMERVEAAAGEARRESTPDPR